MKNYCGNFLFTEISECFEDWTSSPQSPPNSKFMSVHCTAFSFGFQLFNNYDIISYFAKICAFEEDSFENSTHYLH
jgi:hypothetical protein